MQRLILEVKKYLRLGLLLFTSAFCASAYDTAAGAVAETEPAFVSASCLYYIPPSDRVALISIPKTYLRLTDSGVESRNVRFEFFDEDGRNLLVIEGALEKGRENTISGNQVPVEARLIKFDCEDGVFGTIELIRGDGSSTRLPVISPIGPGARLTATATETLVVANLNRLAKISAMLRFVDSDGNSGMETLELEPLQVVDDLFARTRVDFPWTAGSSLEMTGPLSMAVLRMISGNNELTSIQSVLSSRDPHPGSAVTTPFRCGALDTLNVSYCNSGDPYPLSGWTHPALDIDKGTDNAIRENRVFATLPGTVVGLRSDCPNDGCNEDWGNYVILRHVLDDGRVVHSGYAHLYNENGGQPAGLAMGTDATMTRVVAGQFIGYKGKSSAASTHLHFEVLKNRTSFEGGYQACALHWTPACESINGIQVRTVPASGSSSTEDPAPFRSGGRMALLPFFSRGSGSPAPPSLASYEAYGVAGQRLNVALTLAQATTATLEISGQDDSTPPLSYGIPLSGTGLVKTGYREDLTSDSDGTDYRFSPKSSLMTPGDGFQVKLTILPDSGSRIVDNDSLAGFEFDSRGLTLNGMSDDLPGYLFTAIAFVAQSGQYARWKPSLTSGTYGVWIHLPRLPYGIRASAVRYKIYPTAGSVPLLSDAVNHSDGQIQDQWVRLKIGAQQTWNFDGTGFVGLSIDAAGGNSSIPVGSLVAIDAVKFVTTASQPTLSQFSINSGASSTTSTSVNLNNSALNTPTHYMASQSSEFSGASWLSYSTAPSYSLTSGNGTKTVYLKVKNAAGTSNVRSDSITLSVPILPTLSTFSINSGASSTTSASVNLNNSALNTPTHYMASQSSEFSGASWLSYSTAPSYSLTSGNGTKTVYLKVKNAAGTSNVRSDSITLSVPILPTLSTFSINSGASSTTSTSVDLNNSALNTPTHYMASQSSEFSGASWLPYSTAPSYSLTSGNGTKTVYLKVKNAAGTSNVRSDSITLSIPPTYTSSPSPGVFTSGGNVLKLKVSFSGTQATFTVAKQDGSTFQTGGTMTLRAGTAASGCVANNNTYFWSYSSGGTSTSKTFNLATYFATGSKNFYAAIGKPATYCDATPPTYYSGRLTVTAQ